MENFSSVASNRKKNKNEHTTSWDEYDDDDDVDIKQRITVKSENVYTDTLLPRQNTEKSVKTGNKWVWSRSRI